MKNFYLVIILVCLSNWNVFSNDKLPKNRTCATKIPTASWYQQFNQKLQMAALQSATQRTEASYTIPVIVHVVYWNSVENISQAQVNSQIPVLNADFAGTGFNSSNCPAAFLPYKANTNISFCLASKDPYGNTLAETGIHRVNAQTAGFTNPGSSGWSDSYIDNTIKPQTYWDPTKYLNIWVLKIDGGTLGYATFPGGYEEEDGVVINYECFGTSGTAVAPYNKGRTATHEIGHWLGLSHISGDEACGNDYVGDTPPQAGGNDGGSGGLNFGCPTFPFQANSCGAGTSPNGEMFMNFMDYVDDACMYMFTAGQSTRMHNAITSDAMRAALVTSTVCTSTPAAPVANFSADKTDVCPSTTITFSDLSSNTPTSWLWTITPASGWSFTNGTTSASKNPKILFNTAGNYTITLKATNSIGNDTEVKTNYIKVSTPTGQSLPFSEGFQNATFPPTGWSLVSNSTHNWERKTSVGAYGASNACMYYNNYDIDASYLKDEIHSPYINLTGASNPKIKFDVAYARYSNLSTDTLEVLVALACSNTVQSIYKKGGSTLATAANYNNNFVPTSAQWRTDSINIPPAFINQKIKLIFRNNGAYGNNVYVDNINVYNSVVTGLKQHQLDIVYAIIPNPSNGNFDLNITSKQAKNYTLKLYNINGQVLLEENLDLRIGLNNKHISLEHIEKGMYYLCITGDEGVSTQSILIQ